MTRGEFSGKTSGRPFLFRNSFDHLPTKRAPLCTILRYPFLMTDPKIFLNAPLAPMYTNFEGESAPKTRNFLVKIFQKLPKNAFLDRCFKKCGSVAKTGCFYCIGRARKINLDDLKKFNKIFENPRSAPGFRDHL